ncbi:hypothetical protein, partial [Mesorhizobium sp. M4B.F.Ca.ET.200.01.1.1]|uniref:hypothetical protein n=1 Tax=Mesorhizobium sp. M4B.F.Ca.ET.200.01.1.1 TaxID=2563952 RepID=UPI001AED398A
MPKLAQGQQSSQPNCREVWVCFAPDTQEISNAGQGGCEAGLWQTMSISQAVEAAGNGSQSEFR